MTSIPASRENGKCTSSGVSSTTLLMPEDLADRNIPDDPRISPDGSRIVFVVAAASKAAEKRRRSLWIADDALAPRQLTAGTADESDPRWSPDGARILFRSDRLKPGSDEYQLFLLSFSGGEGLPLGELHGELSRPAWSPDGRRVAVLRKDPEPEEVAARKKERDDAVVVEGHPRFTRLWLIDVERGRARCLTTGEREVRCFSWAPMGSRWSL